MKKQKRRYAALAIVLLAAMVWLFEGPGGRPPAWWKDPNFSPLASGPLRWRLVAPLLKLTGSLGEITWSELMTYSGRYSGPQEEAGFVTLVRRDEGAACPALWDTPLGQVWGREVDGPLLEFLVIEQLIERIYDNSSIGVEPGDVVLDVGGHLGVFTRFALVKGARQVVVIEPEPTNLACLKKTFADELRQGTVVLVEAAAWDRRDTLTFAIHNEINSGGGMVGDGYAYKTEHIEVPALPIDDMVAEAGLEQVDFLKMDIEGAEREALSGAQGVLDRFSPRVALCTYHKKGDREALTELVMAGRPGYRAEPGRHHAYFLVGQAVPASPAP